MAWLNNAQARAAWQPECSFPKVTIDLYSDDGASITVHRDTLEAWLAFDDMLRLFDYKAIKNQTGATVCRKITGGTASSLHAHGIAIDINWLLNGYGKRPPRDIPIPLANAIKSIKCGNGSQVFGWGGDYKGNIDYMHFEIRCSPADLRTGIRISTPTAPKEWDEMATKDEVKQAAYEGTLDALKKYESAQKDDVAYAVMNITGNEFGLADWKARAWDKIGKLFTLRWVLTGKK